MSSGPGMDPNEAVLQIAAYTNYTRADVQRWFARHYRLTGRLPFVYPSTIQALRTYAKVPNEPFREPYERLFLARTFGVPTGGRRAAGDMNYNSAFYSRFYEELDTLRNGRKIGPSKASPTDINDYLRDALGFRVRNDGRGKQVVSWLLQYEVAEALAKTLGLLPYQCGI